MVSQHNYLVSGKVGLSPVVLDELWFVSASLLNPFCFHSNWSGVVFVTQPWPVTHKGKWEPVPFWKKKRKTRTHEINSFVSGFLFWRKIHGFIIQQPHCNNEETGLKKKSSMLGWWDRRRELHLWQHCWIAALSLGTISFQISMRKINHSLLKLLLFRDSLICSQKHS